MSTDRDANGRFLPGHPGMGGRPRRAVESDYLSALAEACPLPTWREIVAKAIEQATAGDWRAREWLGQYLLGTSGGNRLLRLAAEELAEFDAVAAEADDLSELASVQDLVRDLRSGRED
jgi:hypothetical protein